MPGTFRGNRMPPQGRGCGLGLKIKTRVETQNQIEVTVAGLNRLARNLWWTWNQDAQDVFEELSPRAWRYLYHNAVAVLRELSDEELRARLLDEEFNGRVQEVLRQFDAYLGATDTWAAEHAPGLAKRQVAYFSAEFGFHETLPIAAGGLGMLARALAKPSNLLLLDEPTNDLDLETLDLLQEMLADYPGTVILVSHDRDFLDRVVTSVIAHKDDAEGAGRWLEYAGGYSDMLAQRGARSEPAGTNISNKAKATAKAKSKTKNGAKLSFKDKHALETLPDQMAALQTKIGEIEQTLADPAFYGRDPEGFDAASARLTIVMAELDAAEENWLRLEMLREELEA